MVKFKHPFYAYVMAAGCGLLASLALPPISLIIGIFMLTPPVLMLARANSARQAFFLGWATGFGWFVLSLYWISNALVTSGGGHLLLVPFTGLGIPLFLGLFWGAGFWVCHRVAAAMKFSLMLRVLCWVLILAAAEYIRGHIWTGFPWNAPGLVAASHEAGLAMSAFMGYWGMTMLVLAVGVIPALLIVKARATVAVIFMVLAGLIVLAYDHLSNPLQDTTAKGMQVRLVQPNIAQAQKWQRDLRPQHLEALVSSSRQSPPRLDLIVWPETAFAGVYERERGVFTATTQAASSGLTPILTGVLRVDEDPFALFNAVMMIGADGRVLGSASKSHLVPFGEYAPFRDYIPFVDVIAGPLDFSAGKSGEILSLMRQDGRQVRLLPLICYEIIFPAATRRDMAEADIMVSITNDAWFGDSIGPRQHLAMAQMRAAELGRPLIRVANTGISAVINSHGRITSQIDYGQAGFADAEIDGAADTMYRRYGDCIFFSLIVMMIGVIAVVHRLTNSVTQD
jgi:apolipoprotein N-acyltransferase